MKKIAIIGINNAWSSNQLLEEVYSRTGSRYLFELEDISMDLSTGKVFYKDIILNKMDAIIIKKAGKEYSPNLLNRLEMMKFLNKNGVKVFSNPDSIMIATNRLTGTTVLRNANIPIPSTTITENIDVALDAVKKYQKAIFKPLYTSKARGMTIIENNSDAISKIKTFKESGNTMMYIQKMVNISGKDLGLVFINNKYIGTYARVGNKDSWNTTTVNGGKYEPFKADDGIIELAYHAQKPFKLDLTCVDIALTSNGPLVFEVSAFGGFRGLYESSNVNLAKLYTDHVIKNI